MRSNPSEAPTRRSDGEQTHAAILASAMALASVEGLGGLTIGRLADALGLSKSGVYAHFRSKRRLQLEVIGAAREVFTREVIEPGLAAPEGVGQLRGLCEAFLDYIRREVFPGGCIFAGLLSEFDAQPGPLHDEVASDQGEWLGLLRQATQRACELGEFEGDVEPEQVAFELHAALEMANYLYVLHHDPTVLDRARVAIDAAVRRASRRPRGRNHAPGERPESPK